MKARMIFGVHERAPQRDRDGNELPGLEFKAYLRFDADGTVRAYEYSTLGIDECGDKPQLDGAFALDGDLIHFTLTRRRRPEKIDPAVDDVESWPLESRAYFMDGEYAAFLEGGVLQIEAGPSGNPIWDLEVLASEGPAFLVPGAGPALPAAPPPAPPPPPQRIPEEGKEAAAPLDLDTLVSRTKWGITLGVVSIGMAIFGVVWSESPMASPSLWTALALFFTGVLVAPSAEQRGEFGDLATDLAAQAMAGVIGRVFMFALVWGVILYGVDVAGWAKDKAVGAYEAGKDLAKSEEEDARGMISATEQKIGALPSPSATRQRLKLETDLARELAAKADTPETRSMAIDAYGYAARTASSRDDLGELEKLISEQVALDRKAGSR